MIYFISGGSKSGKSSFSEDLCVVLSKENRRYYVATMIPYDNEDEERIRKHQEERKEKGFFTIETKNFLSEALINNHKSDYLLIDSLTAYVLNCMFLDENRTKEEVLTLMKEDIGSLLNQFENIFFVADYIFNDCENFTQFTKDYLALLGRLSTYIVTKADYVIEMKSGIPIYLKGGNQNENN